MHAVAEGLSRSVFFQALLTAPFLRLVGGNGFSKETQRRDRSTTYIRIARWGIAVIADIARDPTPSCAKPAQSGDPGDRAGSGKPKPFTAEDAEVAGGKKSRFLGRSPRNDKSFRG